MAETAKQNETQEVASKEEIVVASMLFDEECRTYFSMKPLTSEIFQDKRTQRLVQAFNDVALFGAAPTINLMVDQINPKNDDERKRTLDYIKHLEKNVECETKEAVDIYVKILRKRYANNLYQQMGHNVVRMARKEMEKDENISSLEEKNLIEQYIENMLYEFSKFINDDEAEKKTYSLTEGIQYTIENMNESMTSASSENVTTGYKELDEALDGGFKKGTFAIIAARPGMGKTVWMLNSAVEAAIRGVKTLFISIEMPALQLFQRVLSKLADLPMGAIQRPEGMSNKDWDKIHKAANEVVDVYGENFFVEEITEVTVAQLERIVKHFVKKHGVEAVYVDYAQIMLRRDGQEPKESSDFDEISGGLRRISKKLNVAMVVGSQLNRKVEERENKRPVMSDIRNSGAFEQDAARIIALYRDEAYNDDSEKPNVIELIFLKNRFGKNNITLDFNYDLSKQKIMGQAKDLSQAS